MKHFDIETPVKSSGLQRVKIHDNTQKAGRITFEAHVRVLQKQMKGRITIKD